MSSILLIEDNEKHLASLDDLITAGNTVDVATDFDGAMEKLFGKERYGTSNHPTFPPKYDAVLTDLNFCYGADCASSQESRTQAPLGLSVIFAAARAKIPRIGMLTDSNHQSNAISATWDFLYPDSKNPDEKRWIGSNHSRPIWQLNDSKVIMLDERDLQRLYVIDGQKFRADKTSDGFQLASKYAQQKTGIQSQFEALKAVPHSVVKDYFALNEALKTI